MPASGKNILLEIIFRKLTLLGLRGPHKPKRFVHNCPQPVCRYSVRHQLGFIQTASNCWTKSAEVTTSTFKLRTRSIVPASTRDRYGIAFIGEYCMAICLAECSMEPKNRLLFPPGNVGSGSPGKPSKTWGSMRCCSLIRRALLRESNSTNVSRHVESRGPAATLGRQWGRDGESHRITAIKPWLIPDGLLNTGHPRAETKTTRPWPPS